MAIYEITSFRGGLSDYEDKGIAGSFKFGYNLDIRKQIDSLTCQQALVEEGLIDGNASGSQSPSASASQSMSPSLSPSASPSPSRGSASPSVSPSASLSPSASPSSSSSISPSLSPSSEMTTIFKGIIHWFVPASDGNLYGFDNVGRVYKRNSSGVWTQVYRDAHGAIKGAAEWYSDSGKTYLYWATDTRLNRKELPGLANWNDVNKDTGWPKTNLTSADSHMMREAGGSLIIANGKDLALVGYDDSYTNEALNLIPGNIARTIVERDGRTVSGAARASDPTRGVNAAIDAEIPLAQIGNDGELFHANMVDSIPIKRFPGGGRVNAGGVTNQVDQVNFFEWEQNALSWIDKQAVGNMALFGVYAAETGKNGIYSYGRKNKNHPLTMNLEYKMDVDEIGAIVHTNGKTFASYRDGNEFGVRAVSTVAKSEAAYEGLDFKSPVKNVSNVTVWGLAEVFCSPLPAGCSIRFEYKIDKTGDFIPAKVADHSDSFTTTNGKKAVFSITAEGQIFEPRLILTPNGNATPEVFRVRVYFN